MMFIFGRIKEGDPRFKMVENQIEELKNDLETFPDELEASLSEVLTNALKFK
ncbi:hypothetical protein [Alkalihalobacillus trypoxylicola]|uniref:hypothetical protein n=1 Tax=Alkalihalobacillus trypoxylicola TaxID=519424 RepID=UPI000AD89F6B|nr:hypothetical protein [Alkalihalobacillus trypoxylicola]